jgi:2-desacetyl-2-hydroxyethyl bacteriochlorophyllide A dehydrogenase
MCERISVPEGNLYAAGSLTVEQAATTEFLAIGAHAVARSDLSDGAPTLVVGAGPIGLGTALFATMARGDVTIMDYDRERLAVAVESGIAARAIEARGGEEDRVDKATHGDGFDFVFDATGSRASMEESFLHVAHGGALVMVGVVSKPITFSDPEFHKREMKVLASRNALRSDFERVMTAVEQGRVPLDRLLTHRTTLAGAVGDIPRWASDKKGLVKALVEIR